MIKALLLDVDGTLLDFNAAMHEAIKPILKKYNIKHTKEIDLEYAKLNQKYWHMLENKEITLDDLFHMRFKELLKNHGVDSDAFELNDEYNNILKNNATLYPNVLEFLKKAHKKYRLYILTNALKKTQINRLEKSHIIDFIDKVYISEDIGYKKPEKEYFNKVIEDIGLKKEECIMIGDSLTSDIAGAINANLDYILIDYCDVNKDFNGKRVLNLLDVFSLIK